MNDSVHFDRHNAKESDMSDLASRAASGSSDRVNAPVADKRDYLIGLIGENIQASRSPALHEAEGQALGLRYAYRLIDLAAKGLDVSDLPELVSAAKRIGFDGFNVTHPAKQAIIPLLDAVDPDAAAIGAVNTVRIADGVATGFNTDAIGFAEGIRRGLPGAPMRSVVQLGAGGAGAATAHAILRLGAERLAIFDADPARASALADRLAASFGEERLARATDLAQAMTGADGLVHSTPTGMAEHPGLPLPADLLRANLWVAEIVYFPLETELLRTARALGCLTVDGGDMVVFQAAAAIEIFTGRTVEGERMRRHFEAMG
jgi:shikimate dehydrogenase